MSNDTQTLTLTDFLLARIADDKAEATEARDSQPYDLNEVGGAVAEGMRLVRQSRAPRVLAECEAKRRIVGYYTEAVAEGVHRDNYWPYEDVLLVLASIYADHPDYRKEWRP